MTHGPNFIIEAHVVSVVPSPPKNNEEKKIIRTQKKNLSQSCSTMVEKKL